MATRLRGRDLLLAVAEGTAGAVGEEFLRKLVQAVAEAFGAKLVFVGEPLDGAHIRSIAGWFDGAPMDEPFVYEADGTPCALVVEHAFLAFPDALAERFPRARPAIDMGLESYLAICLRAADGTHLGHLAVLDAQPMQADEEDVAALRIFASRAAAELERRRQAAALEASRERVIAAADAERRRIGRDLHDGAQQRLMAVATFLRVAQKRVDDPALEQAAAELAEANAELRELARGLYPVALTERGLCEAVESLAAGSAIPVTCDIPDVDLPESAALTAYFVISESLANVVRYARASAAHVRVTVADGELLVEVSDDGVGGADPSRGTGLRGLEDRVQMHGGTLRVESPPGVGTRVLATLAIDGAATAPAGP